MSKYTTQQLSAMAQTALDDKASGGHKYLQLVMTLCMMTGLAADEVERKIEAMV